MGLYHPPRISVVDILQRVDLVAISHNGTDHFDALLPIHKTLALPRIGCCSSPSMPVICCDFCSAPIASPSLACAGCKSVHAHAECYARFFGLGGVYMCDECE